jgi:hypothetical protein
MNDDKNLMDKTAEAVTSAARTVSDGLKSAGRTAVKAITPKPIKAGDKVIIPSTDPSMPPVIMPVRKRVRAKAGKAAAPANRRTKVTRKSRAGSRKHPAKSAKSRADAARKTRTATKTRTTRKTAQRQPRRTAGRRTAKAARR